ncbi:MAG: MarR family winged helix-turn-helix transcriptional regulator [Burkholderiales bacterium]
MSSNADLKTRRSEPAELPAPRGCTNLKLRQLARRVSQHYDRIVGAVGLKTSQYSLLSHVVTLGPIRPSDLAGHMEMDASTLTRNLQPLVAQGWVEVGPGDDGRSRLVIATDAGRRKRTEAQREWKRAQLSLNDKLGIDRVAQLHALIDECLTLMKQEPGDIDE